MREIEHLSRLYIAYQFLLAEDTKDRSAEELKEMQDKITKLQEELSETDKKIKALNHEIEELETRKDKVRICKLKQITYSQISTLQMIFWIHWALLSVLPCSS